MCVCTLCGQGVLCGGGAPGEREGGRWGENWPVSTMSTKLSRAYTFPGRGVACVFYKKNVFSTHFGIFYREFFVDIVDKFFEVLLTNLVLLTGFVDNFGRFVYRNFWKRKGESGNRKVER